MDSAISYEQIIAGRYALYGPIASGGMATVHFGRLLGSAGFQRTVAIKRLRGEFLDAPEFISTLLDEARLASRIRHPNVVATLDMVASGDEVFLVMDYVSGESLSRLLAGLHARGKRMSVPIAAGILCGVLHGLHAAHEAKDERGEPLGIVHRDVSPQNVLIGTDGLARLLDFGIAKGKGRLQTTRAGQLKGKVGYMAPEQILGEEPDRRTDVYAASVVLWEALTGRRLFGQFDDSPEGDSYKLIPTILEAKVPAPRSIVPELPADLEAIVMRGLHRRRDERFASARELAVALEESCGIATNRQIGDWVEDVAHDALTKRAVLLAALEQASSREEGAGRPIVDATMRQRRNKRLERERARADEAASDDGKPRSRAKTVPEQDAIEERMRDRASTPRDQDVVDETTTELGRPQPFEEAPTELSMRAPADDGPEEITEVYDKRRHPSLPGAVARVEAEELPLRSNLWLVVVGVLLLVAAVIGAVKLAG